MKSFAESFKDIERLTETENKPLSAMVSQLFQEGGELAEAASITEGHITHKTLSEPLVGEVADVCQVALSILVRATPELSPKERMNLFLSFFEKKNKKWEAVQDQEEQRIQEQANAFSDQVSTRRSVEEQAKPGAKAYDLENRVRSVVATELGLHIRHIKDDERFVEDIGADSLDLVELAMAIEDEFEMEIADLDAERVYTVKELIDYVKSRYGFIPAREDESIGDGDIMEDASQELQAFNFKEQPTPGHYDPAADYTDRTGRHLSLEERMQERSRVNNKTGF